LKNKQTYQALSLATALMMLPHI